MQIHRDAVTSQLLLVPPGAGNEQQTGGGFKVPYFSSREAWVAMTNIQVLSLFVEDVQCDSVD